MLLHDARRDARVDAARRATSPLDAAGPRALGRRAGSARACARSTRALRLRRPGPYQLQAAIAALHVAGADARSTTDWAQIAELYGALGAIAPSPVVELNRAVAVGFAAGPRGRASSCSSRCWPTRRSSATSRCTPRTPSCCAAPATRAARDAAYERAIALSANAVERAELEQRRARLG